MLKDVGHTGRVLGYRFERDHEDILGVVGLEVQMSRASAGMHELFHGQVQGGHRGAPLLFKSRCFRGLLGVGFHGLSEAKK